MSDRHDRSERPEQSGHEARAVKPRITNANRVIVGFPLSTIKIEDATGSASVAELVARLCRLLAKAPSESDLLKMADEAEDLADQLRT